MNLTCDWSMMSSFAYCPQRYFREHVEGWTSTRPATSLSFGGALHKGLQAICENIELSGAISYFRLLFAPFDGLDKVRTMEKGEEILRAFVEQGRNKDWKTELCEVSFNFEAAPGFHYCGKIDRLGKKEGVRAVQDFKTSTQPWQFISNPNHQATGYLTGVKTVLDPKVEEFYFEMIRVQGSSKEGYVTIKGKPGQESRTESIFQSMLVTRSQKQIEGFLQDILGWAEQIQVCMDSSRWPKNTENCNGKYGLCQFHPVCLAGEGGEAVLEMMYKKEKWNPIEGRRGGNE